MSLDSKIPSGPIEQKWSKHKMDSKLINPANKRKFSIIVVGSGLAGGAAAATLSELGYQVKCFCYQDSPRRAHSIAAQGGINAAKNYQNDGDSVRRLFYDTVKGGDFRAREANVHRLAEVSVNIIDQCVAQGVPFAREYGGLLDNRSFGGAQVSRTFYARGQTGQQLLIGCYQALEKEIHKGGVKMFPRTEMLDVVLVDGHAKGIVVRDMVSGKIESHAADAVILATGGYGNVFFLSTNAMGCNVTAAWRAARRGAYFANPCYTQIHPTCIPVSGDYQSKLTLMSESLRNDGRIWVPKSAEVAAKIRAGQLKASDVKEDDRDYFLERKYPSFGNLSPRDISSRAAKEVCDAGLGVAKTGLGVFLDFRDATDRLGASALMQGLADGYFVIPTTIANYLATQKPGSVKTDHPEFKKTEEEVNARTNRMLTVNGTRTVDSFHKQLGEIMWNQCGMARSREGLTQAIAEIPKLREEFWNNVRVPGSGAGSNMELEKAGRVADFLEFGEMMCYDARDREESCGGHFRVEHQFTEADSEVQAGKTQSGEAKRHDDKFCHVSAWEYKGEGAEPVLHKEPLEFEAIHLSIRSYA